MSPTESDRIIDLWEKDRYKLLVSKKNHYAVRALLKKANTISVNHDLSSKVYNYIFKGNIRDVSLREGTIVYQGKRYWSNRKISKVDEVYGVENAVVKPMILDRYMYGYSVPREKGVYHLTVHTENSGRLVCERREDQTLDRNSTVRRVDGRKEFIYYNSMQKLFVEAPYVLYKSLLLNQVGNDIDLVEVLESDMFDILFELHRLRLEKTSSRSVVGSLYHSSTNNGRDNELSTFYRDNLKRLPNLFASKLNLDARLSYGSKYLSIAKNNGILSKDKDIYKYLSLIDRFTDTKEISRYIKLLNYRVINKSTYFISYSSKDGEFVDELIAMFRKRGIHLVDYKSDFRSMSLANYMRYSITESDFVIAVVSDRYLQSDKCMYELQIAMQKEVETNRRLLHPLMLDKTSEADAVKLISKSLSYDRDMGLFKSLLSRQMFDMSEYKVGYDGYFNERLIDEFSSVVL